jgi:hypothetical protein
LRTLNKCALNLDFTNAKILHLYGSVFNVLYDDKALAMLCIRKIRLYMKALWKTFACILVKNEVLYLYLYLDDAVFRYVYINDLLIGTLRLHISLRTAVVL